MKILRLAREACDDPNLVSSDLWGCFTEPSCLHGQQYTTFLGEFDDGRYFFEALHSRASAEPWSRLTAAYLLGAIKRNPTWVDSILDTLIAAQEGPKLFLLQALWLLGPTEANRARLNRMLRMHLVSPDEVSLTFSAGRWLVDLPVEEVRAILSFVCAGPDRFMPMMRVASLYLTGKKHLPKELFDLFIPGLKSANGGYGRDTYELDHVAAGIAETDLKSGLKLFRDLVRSLSNVKTNRWMFGWNPLDPYGTSDFWIYLRNNAPKRAYEILGQWAIKAPGPERSQSNREAKLLDFEAHAKVLGARAGWSALRRLNGTPRKFSFVVPGMTRKAFSSSLAASSKDIFPTWRL